MTTRPAAPARTSLFPRTALEAAQDALKAAKRATGRTRGEMAVAGLTEAARKAEAGRPHLRAAARDRRWPWSGKGAPDLGPQLPEGEHLSLGSMFTLGGE